MFNKKIHLTSHILLLLIIIILTIYIIKIKKNEPIKELLLSNTTKKGLFINFGSDEDILFKSKKNIDKALAYAKQVKSELIYVHVYANDLCYFNCNEFTNSNYKKYSQNEGEDLFQYLIDRAKQINMKCYAWVNCFAFVPSRINNHYLLKKYGKEILSKDQYNRYYDGTISETGRDKYYWRSELVWLEPGDLRVQRYLLNIFQILLKNYPDLEGLILDFIRYPIDPPFMPGSRYVRWGYTSGYGIQNLKRFYKKYNFYPTIDNIAKKVNYSIEAYKRSLQWNEWRRNQITSFVSNLRLICKEKKLTAAVFPYPEMMFLHGFQHWRKWLEKDYMDYVVLMSYTLNPEYLYYSSKLAHSTYGDKIWIGLGCYLMDNYTRTLQQQLDIIHHLKIPGIAYYEYFDIKNCNNVKAKIESYKVKSVDVKNLSLLNK